jgi:aldose 1-epimerase
MAGTEWGRVRPGMAHLLTIKDGATCRASLSDFGARLVSLWTPDRSGILADIVLGHDTAAEYETPASGYIGATCGRYANRIAGGAFTLDGQACLLDQNEGANHLHGGRNGFDTALWQIEEATETLARFSLTSPHGDMGYPGALRAEVTYAFTAPAQFQITMTAQVTGAPTIVNMVNHAYFNLCGQGSGPIDAQLLHADAPRYLPVDASLIPAGEIAPVEATPFDFRTPRPLGKEAPPGGFDHNLCLAATSTPQITARDPASGRGFTLWTDQPGVQLYTAAHIPQGLRGKQGVPLGPRAGFTLETQCWPDSPNRPLFPSARLAPGETYLHRMYFNLMPA